MISLITSSADDKNFELLAASVETTIGVPYELIKIHNPGTMGICEAYNKGAAKAQYDVLCFVHDDVSFKTNDWGKVLLNHFNTLENPGVIGIAGAVYKTKMLSSWWQEPYNSYEPKRCRLIQHFKYLHNIEPHYTYFNPFDQLHAEVVSLDGLFLAMEKNTWQVNRFDDVLLKGFHGYDLDICLSVYRSKKNYVVFDILVDHFSEGRNDEVWIAENIKVHQKHNNNLPVILTGINTKNQVFDIDKIDSDWIAHWLRVMYVQSVGYFKTISYYHAMVDLKKKRALNIIRSWYTVSFYFTKTSLAKFKAKYI